MSDTTPQPVSNGYRKYVKSKIKFNTFNTFNNVTEQELEQIPFRMISHLAMETEHCIVYESTNPFFKLRMCKHTTRRKNGDFGKSYVHYELNGKVYKTKEELLDTINNMNYGKDKEQSDTTKDDV